MPRRPKEPPVDGQCLPCTFLGLEVKAVTHRQVFLPADESAWVNLCEGHREMPYAKVRDAFLRMVGEAD